MDLGALAGEAHPQVTPVDADVTVAELDNSRTPSMFDLIGTRLKEPTPLHDRQDGVVVSGTCRIVFIGGTSNMLALA
jgi:hypothetical protein